MSEPSRRMTLEDYEEAGVEAPIHVRCSIGSCNRHGRCMYQQHWRCPAAADEAREEGAAQVKQCEACDATDADGNEFCEGCDCCTECCNCTPSDCDCAACEVRRENEC
jgi:hypothetical protein